MSRDPRPISQAVTVSFGDHDFSKLESPRELTGWERDVLLASMATDSALAPAVTAQSRTLRVVEECIECPTVIVRPGQDAVPIRSVSTDGPRQFGVIGRGLYAGDVDHVPIFANVHVRDGYIAEIEVIRVDGAPVQQLPSVGALQPMPEGEFEIPPAD